MMRMLKIAAISLSGLMLTSGCTLSLQDNFWADRWNALVASGLEIVVKLINGSLSVL